MVANPPAPDGGLPKDPRAVAALAARNSHFARLVEEHRLLCLAIAGAESGSRPVPPLHLEAMRRTRLALADAIHLMLGGTV